MALSRQAGGYCSYYYLPNVVLTLSSCSWFPCMEHSFSLFLNLPCPGPTGVLPALEFFTDSHQLAPTCLLSELINASGSNHYCSNCCSDCIHSFPCAWLCSEEYPSCSFLLLIRARRSLCKILNHGLSGSNPIQIGRLFRLLSGALESWGPGDYCQGAISSGYCCTPGDGCLPCLGLAISPVCGTDQELWPHDALLLSSPLLSSTSSHLLPAPPPISLDRLPRFTRVELRFDSELPDGQSKNGKHSQLCASCCPPGEIGRFPKGSHVFSDRVERKLSHGLPVRDPVDAVGTILNIPTEVLQQVLQGSVYWVNVMTIC